MPEGQMKAAVIFYIISGEVQVTVNEEQSFITEGQSLITKPAGVSMVTRNGVKILAVQITSEGDSDWLPHHNKEEGAIKDSVMKLNYIFTISKTLISKTLFHLTKEAHSF